MQDVLALMVLYIRACLLRSQALANCLLLLLYFFPFLCIFSKRAFNVTGVYNTIGCRHITPVDFDCSVIDKCLKWYWQRSIGAFSLILSL